MYIYKKKSFKKTGLYIVFQAGSSYEKDGQHGCHHLMEHLITNTIQDQFDDFQKYNIDFNAYTSTDLLVVHFTGMDKYLTPEWKKLLIERVTTGFDTYVTKEVFEKEQKIVYQEILDAFNRPIEGKLHNLLRQHFNNDFVLGKTEDVMNFTLADAKKLFKELFKPVRIVEVGPRQTTGVKVKFLTKIPEITTKLRWKKDYKVSLMPVPAPEKETVFAICKKPVSKKDYPYVVIALEMLNGKLTSPLYHEIREKRGLAYQSRAGVIEYVNNGILMLSATTDPEHAEELKTVYTKYISNFKKYLPKKEFNLVIQQETICREEKKLLYFANCGDLINKGGMDLPKNLNKIDYKKVIEVMEKYAPYFEIL